MSLSSKLSINDVDVKGKRVLIRVSLSPISLLSNGFEIFFLGRHDSARSKVLITS